MSNIIRVAGIDPAIANFGMALGDYDLEKGVLTIKSLNLVETKRVVSKTVLRGSDDLRRCREIVKSMNDYIGDATLGFAEVPSGGAKSADALKALSMATGVLAGCPIELVEVRPSEVKMATVGSKTAAKEDMIEWAIEKHPEAPWLTYKRNGEVLYNAKNEHLADAVCAIYAGLRTPQFKQVVAILTSIRSSEPC